MGNKNIMFGISQIYLQIIDPNLLKRRYNDAFAKHLGDNMPDEISEQQLGGWQNFSRILRLPYYLLESLWSYFNYTHQKETSGTLSKSSYPKKDVPKANWDRYDDLEINADLFKKGVIAVRPYMLNPPSESITDGTSFVLSSRLLTFGKIGDKGRVKKTEALFNCLEAFCEQPDVLDNKSIIFNKTRREESFLPFVLQDPQQKNIGFYLYPWIPCNHKDFKFSGFKQFVVAGCIFGAFIKGRDQYDATFELIKHDIRFHASQKIVDIECNLTMFSAYETMLFSEFEKLAVLMKRLTKKGEPTQLCYHLPYYDYILFGVELFIRGRMTLPALNLFFKAIFLRKKQHENEINRICLLHDIRVKIGSPFENLFGELTSRDEYAQFILNKLGLSDEEVEPALDIELQNEKEKTLVQRCLKILRTNSDNEEHRQIWENFIDTNEQELINLEQLFKMANALMIALASKRQGDFETCSLLPLSEKQIQVSFADFNKKLNIKYPIVFNITTLDPLISYDNNNKNHGLLFYFRNCQESLTKLITKRKILDDAHTNIGHYAAQEEPTELDTFLQSKKLKASNLL